MLLPSFFFSGKISGHELSKFILSDNNNNNNNNNNKYLAMSSAAVVVWHFKVKMLSADFLLPSVLRVKSRVSQIPVPCKKRNPSIGKNTAEFLYI